MKRKNTLLPGTAGTSCVRLSIENLLLFLYISLGITLLTGCDLDRDEEAEPPAITDLTIDSLSMTVQDIATVTAKVPPNEDPDLQYEYEWITTGGDIKNNGVQKDDTESKEEDNTETEKDDTESKEEDNTETEKDDTESKEEDNTETEKDDTQIIRVTATYIAPKTPGIYTITLRVCTRYAFVEKTVSVEVTDYIVKYMPLDPWKGGACQESLKYELDVKAIRRSPIVLSYTIQQNPRQASADLYLRIGTETVPMKREIGEMNPLESVIYTNKVDITRYINQSGPYKFTFTLKTENPIMENTWLLKEIKVVGIEGNFSPWRSVSRSP